VLTATGLQPIKCTFWRRIFVARLLQEKCREQHRNLYLAFIDLTKAFVNRDLLWTVLSKFGCPLHFLTILREFHDGMKARVIIGGQESDPFEVLAGVKQGCVLAPAIFNLFLVAVTLVFRNGLSPGGGIPFKYRLDGGIFNLRRLQAQTKDSTDTVYELQYADDAALPSNSPSDLQENLNTLADAYHSAGLIINTKKTEILFSNQTFIPVLTVVFHSTRRRSQYNLAVYLPLAVYFHLIPI